MLKLTKASEKELPINSRWKLGIDGRRIWGFDCEFTHLGKRYETNCDTFRIIFEVLGTEQAQLIMAAAIKMGQIKEVTNA